jgi:hypothetical protein
MNSLRKSAIFSEQFIWGASGDEFAEALHGR